MSDGASCCCVSPERKRESASIQSIIFIAFDIDIPCRELSWNVFGGMYVQGTSRTWGAECKFFEYLLRSAIWRNKSFEVHAANSLPGLSHVFEIQKMSGSIPRVLRTASTCQKNGYCRIAVECLRLWSLLTPKSQLADRPTRQAAAASLRRYQKQKPPLCPSSQVRMQKLNSNDLILFYPSNFERTNTTSDTYGCYWWGGGNRKYKVWDDTSCCT